MTNLNCLLDKAQGNTTRADVVIQQQSFTTIQGIE